MRADRLPVPAALHCTVLWLELFAHSRVQLFLQVLNFLCVFLLLVSTYVFEVGLISVILREFRVMAVTAAVYLIVFGVYAAIKLVRWPEGVQGGGRDVHRPLSGVAIASCQPPPMWLLLCEFLRCRWSVTCFNSFCVNYLWSARL